MTAKKKLPIGVQSFRKIRQGDYYYVDKTAFVLSLIEEGSYYFLSRPRRFGKSLLIDTFKELFSGNRELFAGLYAETRWDWSVAYPVLAFSFAGGVLGSVEALQQSLIAQLSQYEQQYRLEVPFAEINIRFKALVREAHAQTGQRVVVLVDEYDKPILDRIEDRAEALRLREVLRDFYSMIKDSDAHVRFAFLTGVSKFSKAGIFSGLNNLRDITVSPGYSAICGYTEKDLDTVFAPELEGLDRQMLRQWYDGYHWLGENVYNPFDVLLFFAERTIAPYWFESGTPTFLIKLLLERGVFTPELGRTIASEMLLSTFDVDTMPVEALLFQTGYLTVHRVEEIAGSRFFHLRYPNREVYQSLSICMAGAFLEDPSRESGLRLDLVRLLKAADFAGLERHFQALFAAIPHDWHRRNAIGEYEGYYASVFYSHFAALGLDIRVEDTTSQGRVDMAVLFEGRVLLFEFKVVEQAPEGKALAQLVAKGYADKYLDRGEPVYLIGVEFSRRTRSVCGFEVQEVQAG
ncbi:MAG: AAA family ATPase [Desulfosarcinaceae bacterium]|jgi:hypothetical protein